MKKFINSVMLLISICTMVQTVNAAEKKQILNNSLQAPEIGRYQLFQGKYKNSDLLNDRVTVDDALFLIDTVTGTLFICDRDHQPVIEGGQVKSFKVNRSCKMFDEMFDVPIDALKKIRESK